MNQPTGYRWAEEQLTAVTIHQIHPCNHALREIGSQQHHDAARNTDRKNRCPKKGGFTMQIVRFRDDVGEVHWGERVSNTRAKLLKGTPLDPSVSVTSVITECRELLAPVDPVNIYCIGKNYADHACETGSRVPERPVVFMKPTSAVQDPEKAIRLPGPTLEKPGVDFEGELAVVIGRIALDVSESEALQYVLGYTCANDVSARWWQKHAGSKQWIRGKGFDTFCPLGPVLVTARDIPDPQNLTIVTTVNGEEMQSDSTRNMVFPVAKLISYLSQGTTLLPGTVILTGTPSGVGFARTPPIYLQPGDEVEVTIEGIGSLRNRVITAESVI
jgi:2-keto-4-pentenoate hydratase/2-oxohepta-3-ene-1,7-dioic acid hydratase in catechol pathway